VILVCLPAVLARAQVSAPLTVVKFDLYHNRVYVPVKVNGEGPFAFVLDTGASMSGLDSALAQRLGTKPKGKTDLQGNGEDRGRIEVTRIVTLSVGGTPIETGMVGIVPFAELETYEGRTVDGVLGLELFKQYLVEIDYERETLKLYESATYSHNGSGGVIPLRMFKGGLVLVRTKVDVSDHDQLETDLAIDSGTYSTLRLHRPFAEKHKMLESSRTIVHSSGFGLGGEFAEALGRVQALELGPFKLVSPLTAFSQASRGQTSRKDLAGTIGGGILRRFTVIFDYSRQQMILEPNSHLHDPFAGDMSGMILTTAPPQFTIITVRHVTENTPAAELGIREGDQIVTLDGQPVGAMGLEKIRQLFEHQAAYRLEITRGERLLQMSCAHGHSFRKTHFAASHGT
jgi:hypothetical protein